MLRKSSSKEIVQRVLVACIILAQVGCSVSNYDYYEGDFQGDYKEFLDGDIPNDRTNRSTFDFLLIYLLSDLYFISHKKISFRLYIKFLYR